MDPATAEYFSVLFPGDDDGFLQGVRYGYLQIETGYPELRHAMLAFVSALEVLSALEDSASKAGMKFSLSHYERILADTFLNAPIGRPKEYRAIYILLLIYTALCLEDYRSRKIAESGKGLPYRPDRLFTDAKREIERWKPFALVAYYASGINVALVKYHGLEFFRLNNFRNYYWHKVRARPNQTLGDFIVEHYQWCHAQGMMEQISRSLHSYNKWTNPIELDTIIPDAIGEITISPPNNQLLGNVIDFHDFIAANSVHKYLPPDGPQLR